MREERKISAADGRIRKGQNSGRKQLMFYLISLSLLLLVNVLLLIKIQAQMDGIHAALAQVLTKLEQYQGVDETGISGAGYSTAPSDSKDDDLSECKVPPVCSEEANYADQWGLSMVAKPVKRNSAEVLVRLKELSKDSEIIEGIYKNHSLYPEKLLEALANNPEMAGFAAGYLDCDAKAAGGLTKAEKEQEYPLFLQWDPRWGYAEYGDDSNIGLAGCGPVCLSMALYYLLGDESLTPDKIAEYSMKNGYYVSGTGTAWSLMTDVPVKYGLGVSQPAASERTMKSVLDEGGIIICSMKPGDFTAVGHFIVIYGYDAEGFRVNDPNCVARSRQRWSFNDLGEQIKHIWVLGEKKLDIKTAVEYYK